MEIYPSPNNSLVRRYYDEMWNRWNYALADEMIAEDMVFRGSLGVSVQGREGFKGYMRQVQRAFPDFHNRIDELIAEGEKVAACLTYTGTHQGVLFGITPTGRRVSYTGMAVFRIVAGCLVEGRVLGDLHSLLTQVTSGPAR